MRNTIKVLFALACFYVFWKFRNTTLGQSSFIVSVIGLFIDDWFLNHLRGGVAHRTSGPQRHADAPQPHTSDGGRPPGGVGDYPAVVVTSVLSAVMADSLFFTTWLDLPPATGSAGNSGLAVVVKVVASVLAIAVVVLAPVVLAAFTYLTCAERLADRSGSPYRNGGCLALFPAALLGIAAYGHFYLAYDFTSSLGCSDRTARPDHRRTLRAVPALLVVQHPRFARGPVRETEDRQRAAPPEPHRRATVVPAPPRTGPRRRRAGPGRGSERGRPLPTAGYASAAMPRAKSRGPPPWRGSPQGRRPPLPASLAAELRRRPARPAAGRPRRSRQPRWNSPGTWAGSPTTSSSGFPCSAPLLLTPSILLTLYDRTPPPPGVAGADRRV